MIKRVLLGTLVAGALLASSAFAADLKVGVIDLRQILQTSSQVKQLNAKLRKQFKPRQDALLGQQKQLKTDLEKFSRDSAVMSKTAKDKLQQKIIGERQTFAQKEQAYQKELKQAQKSSMEEFLNKLKGVVKKVAQADHYTLVLQKSAVPYAADDIDITKKVADKLG